MKNINNKIKITILLILTLFIFSSCNQNVEKRNVPDKNLTDKE